MKEALGKIKRFDAKYNVVTDLLLAFLAALIGCFLFATAYSPFFRIASYDFINKDSNFFYFAAQQILRGHKPYIDVYDHKGLYHLGITMLGILLGGRGGVLALETLNATCTLFLVLRTVRILCEGKQLPRLFALLAATVFTMSLCSGNMEGEWVMIYIAAMLLFFVKGIRNGESKWFYIGSIFMGLEIGVSFNCRPIDAFWCVAAAIYLLVDAIRKKTWKRFFLCAAIAFGAASIPFIIIWPIAAANGFLKEMIDAMYVHSFVYASRTGLVLDTWINRAVIAAVLAVFVFFYFIQRKEDKEIALFFLVLSIIGLSLLFVVARYPNYYWAGFPFYEITITFFLFSVAKHFRYGKINFKVFTGACGVVVATFTVILYSLYYGPGMLDFRYESNLLYQQQIVQAIPEEVRHTPGAVLAIETDCCVYEYGDIDPNYKYFSNQAWWAVDKPEIAAEFKAYLSGENKPQYLIVATMEEVETRYGQTIRDNYDRLAYENQKFSIWQAK